MTHSTNGGPCLFPNIGMTDKQPFEQEHCRCGRPGKLKRSASGGYRWLCSICGVSWVTLGSPMDVANEIIWANDIEEDD